MVQYLSKHKGNLGPDQKTETELANPWRRKHKPTTTRFVGKSSKSRERKNLSRMWEMIQLGQLWAQTDTVPRPGHISSHEINPKASAGLLKENPVMSFWKNAPWTKDLDRKQRASRRESGWHRHREGEHGARWAQGTSIHGDKEGRCCVEKKDLPQEMQHAQSSKSRIHMVQGVLKTKTIVIGRRIWQNHCHRKTEYTIPRMWQKLTAEWVWTCLVAQQLRIHLPVQGTWVQSLVWEDPTCREATEPMRHNYWACALEPECWNYWACVLQPLKPVRLEPVLRNEKPPQRERSPRTTTKRSPHAATRESLCAAMKTQCRQK